MKNPATQPAPEWNEFTEYIRDNPGVFVRMRNGLYVRPVFSPAEDEHCSDGFEFDNNFRWKTDGQSITSSDYDMMELEEVKAEPIKDN